MIGLAALVVVLLTQAPDARVIEDIQRSHIEGNVPPPGQFATLLQRDLEVNLPRFGGHLRPKLLDRVGSNRLSHRGLPPD